MIHEKILRLVPYVNGNFITYPLWEEGKYIPFINFWKTAKTEGDYINMRIDFDKAFEGTGYNVCDDTEYSNGRGVFYFSVYPQFFVLRNGSYKYVKEDWSIEEMLDLLAKVLR